MFLRQPHRRSPRFWYPDGNVVIKVGDTHFKLLRSRLAQQCRYFQELFSPPKDQQSQPSSSTDAALVVAPSKSKKLDGCPIYKISGIDVSDFTTFLNFLEYPVEYSVFTAPSDKLYALLRASDTLGCDLVCDLAKEAVAKQWPSFLPPEKDVHTRLNAASRQRVNDAIRAIVHARKYHISGVLKRAFYELLRNTAFWDAACHTHTHTSSRPRPASQTESGSDSPAAVRDMVALLSHGDLVRLQQTRWELREAWDELVRTPPGSDKGWKGRTCDVCPPAQNGQRQGRTDAWAVETAHAGPCITFGDPIAGTYYVEDWLDRLKGHSRGKWCEGCEGERKYMWGEARTAWWQKLDGWLQTGQGSLAAQVGLERRSGSNSQARRSGV